MSTTTLRRDPVLQALTLSTVTGAISLGLMFSVSVLYLTRVAGLGAREVGVGLTIAGIIGTAATFAGGWLSDRWGPKAVMLVTAALQAAAIAGYCLIDEVLLFVVLACVAFGAQGVRRTAQVTLIAQAFTGPGRTEARARLRVVTNIFVAVGSGIGALVLAIGTAPAYRVALVLAAVLVLWSALPLVSLPTVTGAAEPSDTPSGPTEPLKDRRYLAIAALNGVIHVQFDVLTVAMPLWLALRTEAPEAMVGALIVLNTVLVTLFQVRATRLVTDVRSAGRMVFAATGLLAVACLLYPAAALGGVKAAVLLLVLAVAVSSLGEVLSEAGGWELAFELADSRRPGAYQAVSQTGAALGGALGPLVVTSSAIALGTPGWALLGGLFLAAGAGTGLITGVGRRDGS